MFFRLPKIHLEIIYQGEHCPQCFYMLEAVETVAPKFGDRISYELIEYTKNKAHARRFYELSVSLHGEKAVRGLVRVAPIPSIFIGGKLVFDCIPPLDELEETLAGHLALAEGQASE